MSISDILLAIVVGIAVGRLVSLILQIVFYFFMDVFEWMHERGFKQLR